MLSQSFARGRPPGDKELRRLRALTWYHAVKAREGKTDYKLDEMFGKDKDGVRNKGGYRIRVFEAIRRNGSIPGNGKTGKRKYDLVADVNTTEGYEGTAAIMHSPFWRLLDKKEKTIKEVREMVILCIRNLNIAGAPGDYEDSGINILEAIREDPGLTVEDYLTYQNRVDELYDNAMASAFSFKLYNLDLIALLGFFCLESLHAGKRILAEYHASVFKSSLEIYCIQKWLRGTGDVLLNVGTSRLMDRLRVDPLKGLPTYRSLLEGIAESNPRSPVAALLNHHERELWHM